MKEISFESFSIAAVARKNGVKLSPYELYPERETFTERRVMERPDGTRFVEERRVSRWNGVFSTGEWRVVS